MTMHQEEFVPSPSVWQPADPGTAVRWKEQFGPDAAYVAGSTLLRTQWEAGTAVMPRHLIDLSSIPGLSGVSLQDGELAVGALTTLGQCRNDPLIGEFVPMLREAVRAIAGWSVRNLATIGGNVAFRVGDALPALLALDADLVWHDGRAERAEKAADWLASSASPDARLLTQLRLPVAQDDANSNAKRMFAYHKVGRREAFTPSLVTVALSAHTEPDGVLRRVRIAAGGGQTPPKRLMRVERLLEARKPDPEALGEIYRAVLEEYEPKPDPFASNEYRKAACANLIVAELWKQAGAGPQQKEGA